MNTKIKQSDIVKNLINDLYQFCNEIEAPDEDEKAKKVLANFISAWLFDNEIELKYRTPPGGNLR